MCGWGSYNNREVCGRHFIGAVVLQTWLELSHKAKALSSPRGQWKHKAKAVSSPRRQWKHKAKVVLQTCLQRSHECSSSMQNAQQMRSAGETFVLELQCRKLSAKAEESSMQKENAVTPVRDPPTHNINYPRTRWPQSPRIVIKTRTHEHHFVGDRGG